MLSVGGPQAGSTETAVQSYVLFGVDSVLRADPPAPRAHTEMLPNGPGEVKRRVSPWM